MERDPEAALAEAFALEAGPERDGAMGSALAAWVDRDPVAAEAWVRGQQDAGVRNAVLLPFARALARHDPRKAVADVAKLPVGVERDEGLLQIVTQWAGAEPLAAGLWAQGLHDDRLKLQMLAAVATVWGDSDPAEAARFARDAMPPGRRQNDAIVAIVQRWAQRDPVTVAGWIEQFPPGDLQWGAAQSLVQQWVGSDPAAVAVWLNGMEPASVRDYAVEEFIRWLAARDAAGAAAWAETLSSDASRQQARVYLAAQPR